MDNTYSILAVLAAGVALAGTAQAQKALTWQEVRERFEASNPTMRAARIGIDESKAQEITAYLRPNPDLAFGLDQLNPFTINPYQPFAETLPLVSASYLHEREHKRELRLESARKGTAVTISQTADQERNLLFTLRDAFVQALQAKAVLALARENLAYYDNVLAVSNDRFKAGDIARVDLDRLELQRVQYESDVQTGEVNLRTAKIQLLALLNDAHPVEQFDVAGAFEFTEPATSAGGVPQGRAGRTARPAGGGTVGGQGQDRSPPGGCQRLDRSDLWRGFRPQSAHPRLHTESASISRCASSTAIKARRRARNWTSRATSGCERPPRRRYSAMWIRRGPPSTATWRCSGVTRPDICSRPPACATPFRSLTSTAARRCWIF